jgi:hypothetical protein
MLSSGGKILNNNYIVKIFNQRLNNRCVIINYLLNRSTDLYLFSEIQVRFGQMLKWRHQIQS